MGIKNSIVASIIILSSIFARAESNDKLKLFLTSCAYGTAAGALVGVASLAFATDPTASLNNVARGASLGLYAGIGLGFYLSSQSQTKVDSSSVWVTPQWHQGKIEGAHLGVLAGQF